MILGFLIVNNSGFAIFEHYFENFNQYVDNKTDFFRFIEGVEYNIGKYKFERIKLDITSLDNYHKLALIYLASKSPKDIHIDRLRKLANSVLIADKEVTHEVLKSGYASDLLS